MSRRRKLAEGSLSSHYRADREVPYTRLGGAGRFSAPFAQCAVASPPGQGCPAPAGTVTPFACPWQEIRALTDCFPLPSLRVLKKEPNARGEVLRQASLPIVRPARGLPYAAGPQRATGRTRPCGSFTASSEEGRSEVLPQWAPPRRNRNIGNGVCFLQRREARDSEPSRGSEDRAGGGEGRGFRSALPRPQATRRSWMTREARAHRRHRQGRSREHGDDQALPPPGWRRLPRRCRGPGAAATWNECRDSAL
jgi:hypothetical protein